MTSCLSCYIYVYIYLIVLDLISYAAVSPDLCFSTGRSCSASAQRSQARSAWMPRWECKLGTGGMLKDAKEQIQKSTADLRLLPWYNPSYITPCIKIRGRYSKLYTYPQLWVAKLFWWQCNHSLDLTVPESPKWQSNLKPKRENYKKSLTSLFKVTQYDFWIGGQKQLIPPTKVTHWNFKTGHSSRNMEHYQLGYCVLEGSWESFLALQTSDLPFSARANADFAAGEVSRAKEVTWVKHKNRLFILEIGGFSFVGMAVGMIGRFPMFGLNRFGIFLSVTFQVPCLRYVEVRVALKVFNQYENPMGTYFETLNCMKVFDYRIHELL